jgi:hypothetical protein
MKNNGTKLPSDLDRYHQLLASVENHQEIDDVVFRVLHANTLTSRAPTPIEYVYAYMYLARRFCVTANFYLAPIAIWWIH